MNIASIITSEINCIKLFEQFLLSYKTLTYLYKDSDTMFFSEAGKKTHAIYYHFELVDVDHDLTFNYTKEAISGIKKVFGDAQLFIVDISYNREDLLKEIMRDYRNYLANSEHEQMISLLLLTVPGIDLVSLDDYVES